MLAEHPWSRDRRTPERREGLILENLVQPSEISDEDNPTHKLR